MSDHRNYEELLPFYIADQLSIEERAEIKAHLAECPECRLDLEIWTAAAGEIKTLNRSIVAPPALVQRAISRAKPENRLFGAIRRAWQLLYAQTFLVQREAWPASAAVMVLGVVVALISNHIGVVYFLAPIVAASMMVMFSSRENDPAYELTLATPTSFWMVLLARLSMVSVYNFLLALAATLALLTIVPPGLLGTLILGWLAPMAFFSALALMLSLWIGTGNSLVIIYILWIAQYAPYKSIGSWALSPLWTSIVLAYQGFWDNYLLLFLLSILLVVAALWCAGRPIFRLSEAIR